MSETTELKERVGKPLLVTFLEEAPDVYSYSPVDFNRENHGVTVVRLLRGPVHPDGKEEVSEKGSITVSSEEIERGLNWLSMQQTGEVQQATRLATIAINLAKVHSFAQENQSTP